MKIYQTKGKFEMLTVNQINDRLKQIENTPENERETSFLYDQLWEMQQIANDINTSALFAMNGNNTHV